MPMSIVDPGFRPRLMLDETQALTLVRRACERAASATVPQLESAPALLGTSEGGGGDAAHRRNMADPDLARLVQSHSAGDSVASVQVSHIQRLWGGMGAVLEVLAQTASGATATVIVKHIEVPSYAALSFGDERKRLSYQCEAKFFETTAAELRTVAGCHVPAGLLVDQSDDGFKLNIVMSRLPKRNTPKPLPKPEDTSGGRQQGEFSSESDEPDNTNTELSADETASAVDFIARLHGHTWGCSRAEAFVARGLQPQGSYWYLDTRLDEWEAMPQRGWEGRLRRAARAIDQCLAEGMHQCIVHGDTKADNMIFDDAATVSMCDFQYCGRANPMKDLAYLLCCASESGCSPATSERYLALYHAKLCSVLKDRAGAMGATEKLEIPELSALKVRVPNVLRRLFLLHLDSEPRTRASGNSAGSNRANR